MIHRRFGRTEIRMPVLTCGGMRYQHKWDDVPPGDIPKANQENLESTIHRALELGINHIETARGYGTSEMQLVRLCEPLSPMVFNDLYCLMRPEVHTLSIGAARPTDFDEHVKALGLLDQAETLVPPIDRRLRQTMANALGSEWLESWQHGIPEWEQVPGHINISEILRLWNYAKSLDMVEFGKMRYNLLGNAGHWFPGIIAAKLGEHDLLPFQAHARQSLPNQASL